MMLMHIGQTQVAEKVHNAWLYTIESGIYTADIYRQGVSKTKVGTSEFADEVISSLDKYPTLLQRVNLPSEGTKPFFIPPYQRPIYQKQLVGTDIFICDEQISPNQLAARLTALTPESLKLKMITNRGVKVYPQDHEQTFCTDHWRCRFVASASLTDKEEPAYTPVDFSKILSLQEMLSQAGFEIIKTEHLYTFNGVRAFSLGQGE